MKINYYLFELTFGAEVKLIFAVFLNNLYYNKVL